MPDALAAAFATPGLVWIALAALTAGIVRGFSGFGTAMVFLPVAGQFLPPVAALSVLVTMDFFGPLPNLPRALRDGQPADIGRLLLGTACLLPLGLLVLAALDPAVFRGVVAGVALCLLALLIGGVRYRGTLRPPMVYGIGGLAGLLGGTAGVPGPPVILFYMASPLPATAIRANTLLFLFSFDILFLGLLGLRGDLTLGPVVLGLVMAVPVMLGNLAGAAIFRPERERPYRALAYCIIAASAVSGLPVWR